MAQPYVGAQPGPSATLDECETPQERESFTRSRTTQGLGPYGFGAERPGTECALRLAVGPLPTIYRPTARGSSAGKGTLHNPWGLPLCA
ncbi:hypothetical protein AAur_pTC10119 (plasmid) [Paenarthrobacter aurescens TC1]|nr:hypothetical protein AAur_pTC10119 [Paenarthrobacter aurescens TC1]